MIHNTSHPSHSSTAFSSLFFVFVDTYLPIEIEMLCEALLKCYPQKQHIGFVFVWDLLVCYRRRMWLSSSSLSISNRRGEVSQRRRGGKKSENWNSLKVSRSNEFAFVHICLSSRWNDKEWFGNPVCPSWAPVRQYSREERNHPSGHHDWKEENINTNRCLSLHPTGRQVFNYRLCLFHVRCSRSRWTCWNWECYLRSSLGDTMEGFSSCKVPDNCHIFCSPEMPLEREQTLRSCQSFSSLSTRLPRRRQQANEFKHC